MLPYKNRLVKRKDFEAVYKYGRFFSFGVISLKVKENNLSDLRIGFSIGIKFSKKAVERNRMKRQLREIFKANLARIKQGLDIVVMIQKGERENIKSTELEKVVKEALNKGKLID